MTTDRTTSHSGDDKSSTDSPPGNGDTLLFIHHTSASFHKLYTIQVVNPNDVSFAAIKVNLYC